MMTDYTRIIEDVTIGNHVIPGLIDDDTHLILDVKTRQLTLGPEFNSLIGTTDDLNTNIITFKVPNITEGHDLTQCQHKVIKWHNLASSDKSTSELLSDAGENPDNEYQYLQWVVPAAALTTAGTIKISLCFYDEDENGNTIYRWNSLPFSGLRVEQGMDEIGTETVSVDEIIMVDLRSRQIRVPSALNREVGKVGETSLTTLRFRCDRYYQKTDFNGANILVCYRTKNATSIATSMLDSRVLPSNHGEADLIEFDWKIPQFILQEEGNFEFSICLLKIYEDGKTYSIWYSNPCTEFSIGTTLTMEGEITDPDDTNNELHIVSGEALDKQLTELLGDSEISASGSMTVSEAIAYSIDRFMNAEIAIDSNDIGEE